ncbi:hypothetical protein GEMRC1_013987 [Eukaryota sp. GEM-RC1]
MDKSDPESLSPIKKCWENIQDVRTAPLFTKNPSQRIQHSTPVNSPTSKALERSTTAIEDVVIQSTALKHQVRVEYEAELARRVKSNSIPKVKEVSKSSLIPDPQHDVLSMTDLTETLSSSSISNSSGIPSPLNIGRSPKIIYELFAH